MTTHPSPRHRCPALSVPTTQPDPPHVQPCPWRLPVPARHLSIQSDEPTPAAPLPSPPAAFRPSPTDRPASARARVHPAPTPHLSPPRDDVPFHSDFPCLPQFLPTQPRHSGPQQSLPSPTDLSEPIHCPPLPPDMSTPSDLPLLPAPSRVSPPRPESTCRFRHARSYTSHPGRPGHSARAHPSRACSSLATPDLSDLSTQRARPSPERQVLHTPSRRGSPQPHA